MRDWRNYVLVLFGALLAVVSALLWNQHQVVVGLNSAAAATSRDLTARAADHARLELLARQVAGVKAEAEAAGRELAARTAERDQLEDSAKKFREKTGELHERLVAEREKVKLARESLNAATKQQRAAANFPTGSATVTADQIRQWLAQASDPDVMRRLNAQARDLTLRRYEDLFAELQLPPGQTEAFAKLLADKRQAGLDAAVASLQQGANPQDDLAAFQKLVLDSRQDLETQIHSLLGDDGYLAYQDFDRNLGQANTLNRLDQALHNSGQQLTSDQTARLQQVLQENNTGRVTAPVLAAAKEFLTPAQLQGLQDVRAIQQANSKRRNQLLQPLPATPPPGSGGK